MRPLTRFCSTVALLVAAAAALAGPVNVNTADAETLSAELAGVGMAKAQAIVEYREKNGPFRSPEDLLNVAGIGERTIELNREFILVEPATAERRK